MAKDWTPERVRDLRTRLGLTQTELADRIGCKRLTIQHWEHGRRNPQGLAVAALANLEDYMDLQTETPVADVAAARRKLAEALERAYRTERQYRTAVSSGGVHRSVTEDAVYQARLAARRALEGIAVALDGDERTLIAADELARMDPDALTDPLTLLHPAPQSNDAKRLAILEGLA